MKAKKYIDKNLKTISEYKYSRSINTGGHTGGESIILTEDVYKDDIDPDRTYSSYKLNLYCNGSHSTEVFLGFANLEEAFKELKKVK